MSRFHSFRMDVDNNILVNCLIDGGLLRIYGPETIPEVMYMEFYENFCPDDWDYIIISENADLVRAIANPLGRGLHIDIKAVGKEWWGVVYHS
jgi:hypothetical protein